MEFSVLVLDNGESGERIVGGFRSFDEAREYARRRVRESLEELRKPGQSAEELRKLWHLYGQSAIVLAEPGFKAAAELEEMIARLLG